MHALAIIPQQAGNSRLVASARLQRPTINAVDRTTSAAGRWPKENYKPFIVSWTRRGNADPNNAINRYDRTARHSVSSRAGAHAAV
jgi:hypothetical protein